MKLSMNNKGLKGVLSILAVLTILSGIGYHFVKETPIAFVYIAIFYMPTPLYALCIHSLITKRKQGFKIYRFQ
ncbi:hypothetical protein M601_021280 [Cellulophaga baltica 4]|nr:hypothetical protein M601_021280 [Cellulophaga baltica 4]